ncbi:MAG: acyl-CoA dehydrogenase [Alphaproteobacteria bacterium]|nr:acyl-CoA dehydrogenase [Alphaproteobacteria bacterium]
MTYQAPIQNILFTLKHEVGMDRLLTAESNGLDENLLQSILEEAGKFASDIIAPSNAAGEKQPAQLTDEGVTVCEPYRHVYKQFVENGWPTLTAPQAYGGQALPHVIGNIVGEMVNAANMSFAIGALLTEGAITAIDAHASDEIKTAWLPKLTTGEWMATMNLTEPQAGSDLGAIRSKAIPQADGTYKISGTKIFITYGEHNMVDNIVHLVLARLPDAPNGTRGISMFLVPRYLLDENGKPTIQNDVKCVGVEEKLGSHGSPTCVMSFGEKGGATGWLVGPEHKGMAGMFTMMNNARLGVAMQGVGLADYATQKAISYAQERKQGRAPDAPKDSNDSVAIIHHPDIRHMLMQMQALTNAIRAISYENSILIDLAQRTDDTQAAALSELLTPVSKAFSSDMANEIASLGVQVHGGMGYIEETGAAQFMRDARILAIYEGTNGIQALDLIGRKLPMDNGAVVQVWLDQVGETVAACKKHKDENIQQIGAQLETALQSLKKATDWMLAEQDNRLDKLSGATAYLRLFGLTAGGHYLARGAIAASQMEQTAFARHKQALARFYALHILPQTTGIAFSVLNGGAVVSETAIEDFVA